MPISVPRSYHGGGIPWLTTDPVAEAKALRAQRQTEALGKLGGGLQRGTKNYLKGGMRGMIDPQYAEEQAKADREGQELEARLGEQIGKAGEESKQPAETGSQSADPATKAGDQKQHVSGSALGESTGSWLDKLGRVGSAIYRGPGTHYDIKEVARARGRLAGREDRRKDVEAIAPALKYQKDPGATLGKVYREGLGAIKPGDLQGEQEKMPAGIRTMNYYRELARVGGPGHEDQMDLDAVHKADMADEAAQEETKRRLEEKYRKPDAPRAPTAAESQDATVRRLQADLDSPDPAVRHRAKRELQVRHILERTGAGRSGSTNASTARERLDREDERAYQMAKTLLKREPKPEEIPLFRGRSFADAQKVADELRANEGPTEPTPHGTGGSESSQNQAPDAQPKQHDSRVGEFSEDPSNRVKQRRDYTPAGPKDDVSIYE